MSVKRKAALKRLFAPKSVAVIGGDTAAEVVRQCRSVGFAGDIYAVNPRRDELAGVACVPSIRELPAPPDAAFVAAPPQATLEIVHELARFGVPGAVCFAAGFAEAGASGRLLQQRLRDAAGDMAILGPNCHGFLNYLDGAALWPDQHGGHRVGRGVAIVSQSGNVAINLTMQKRGIDLGYVVSVGNNGVVGMHDIIDVLLDDSRIAAIGLHIEGLEDVAAFSRTAIDALSAGVPIIALKAGRSAGGRHITMGHTGSLAGSDTLYTALFSRLGVARCDTLTQFLETLKFVSQVGTLSNATVGSMSCSGGDAAIVADNAEILGLETPQFSAASARRLKVLLGPNVNVVNPLDYHLYVWGDFDKLRACFTEVLGNAYGCTLLVLDYPPGAGGQDEKWQVAERALTAAVDDTGQRAVVVASLPENLPGDVRDRLKRAGIAPMQGIEDCLYAIRAAAAIGAAQRNAGNIRPLSAPQPADGEIRVYDEWESKQLFADAGIAVPPGRQCAVGDTAAAAEALGYPVALKALSPGLAHKSDVGAIALDLMSGAEVREATERMTPGYDRFLVERMVESPVAELIVAIVRDPTFGLNLMLGSGGTLVELLDDTVFLLLPVTPHDIEMAIRSLKVAKLLRGFRGRPAGNMDAVVTTVECVIALATAKSRRLLELEINPLLVTEDSAYAVDALLRMIPGND